MTLKTEEEEEIKGDEEVELKGAGKKKERKEE